jgi:hypothetical protein
MPNEKLFVLLFNSSYLTGGVIDWIFDKKSGIVVFEVSNVPAVEVVISYLRLVDKVLVTYGPNVYWIYYEKNQKWYLLIIQTYFSSFFRTPFCPLCSKLAEDGHIRVPCARLC